MTKKKYIEGITGRMVSLGTYKEEFSIAIDSLRTILEARDNAFKAWKRSGGEYVVDGGAMPRQNPILREYKDLNSQALRYLKELSLTHASLKRISDASGPEKGKLTLFDRLAAAYEES